ncbi:MAG TPA: GNAT family N-acetyltransferase, partial [Gemmatales bacterium]|nr:GNAT family N-acetyltransferase [Gemmatales bacterium]
FSQLPKKTILPRVPPVCASKITLIIKKNNPPLAGLYALEVHPEFRGQGLAKFLIAQTLQHLNDQLFQNVETVIPIENLEARRLFDAMGFTQIDEGISYAKALG